MTICPNREAWSKTCKKLQAFALGTLLFNQLRRFH